MKDPEWFWGLGNPQDYWYKGITFIFFSFSIKLKNQGYGKTRAIDSQSWIATKTSDQGYKVARPRTASPRLRIAVFLSDY